MRYLFIIIFFSVFFFASSNAQQAHYPDEERIQKGNTVKQKIRGPKDLDKGNRERALDVLLGYLRMQAITIIKLYDYRILEEHEPYPYIREVIEVKNVTRWGYPVTLYFFMDSVSRVVRMNYVFGTPGGMPEDSAHALLQNLHNENEQMDYVSDNEWETASWQRKRAMCLYTFQKGITKAKPAYIITLKSYIDDHLLPYVKEHGWPKDGIFTVSKE